MKNYINNYIFLLLALFFFQSCEKDTTGGFTHITVYPVITISGDNTIFIEKGKVFVDPGVDATLDGVDVTKDIVIKSNVDINKPGKYSVNYSMVNSDGFKVEQSRIVYIYDGSTSPLSSGIYAVQAGSNRNGSIAFSGYPIVIYQVSPGLFSISDYLGGYYDQRAAYGPAYAAIGSFKLNSDNTMTLVTSSVAGWGDALTALANGKYNTTNGELNFTSKYANFDFNVILKK